MRKVDDGGKEKKKKRKKKENNDENSGPLTSLPVERLTACSTATPPLVPIFEYTKTNSTTDGQ